MYDPHDNSNDRIRREIDNLKRRLKLASPDSHKQTCEEWTRELVQPGVPDDVAHTAMSISELLNTVGFTTMPDYKKKLVLVIHGIRDHGPWMEMVKAQLTSSDTFVQPIDFDFFDAPRFMSGWGTSRVMREVTLKIRDAMAKYNDRELIVIAHSFGTYIISNILLNEVDLRCSRAIFCGAVVSKRFRFAKIPNKPHIINECGDRDIWPVLAQGFSIWNRYGASGVWGFRQTGIEDRFHDCTHSDYLKAEFVDHYWEPYIRTGDVVVSKHQSQRHDVPWGVSLLSYGWWLAIPSLVVTTLILIASWYLLRNESIIVGAVLLLATLTGWAIVIKRVVSDVKKFHFPVKLT